MVLASAASAREETVLARVTGYWAHGSGGSGGIAASNGARLRVGHCAVDPKRIPYGSKVIFPDVVCMAVDTGPAVVSRKSSRACGRTAAQKNAIVVDRFFETKRQALTWASRNPMFIPVQIARPNDPATTTVTKTTSRVATNNAAARPPTVAVTTPTVTTTKPLVNYGSTIVHNPLNKLGR